MIPRKDPLWTVPVLGRTNHCYQTYASAAAVTDYNHPDGKFSYGNSGMDWDGVDYGFLHKCLETFFHSSTRVYCGAVYLLTQLCLVLSCIQESTFSFLV